MNNKDRERVINNPDKWRQASEEWLNAYKEFPISTDVSKAMSDMCNKVAEELENNSKFCVCKYITKTTSEIYHKFFKK